MARDMCVTIAAVRLMLKYPYWCELYYTMKVVETFRVPTLATNGKQLYVNPTFWETLTLDYKVSALAHEVAHKMLHHCTRGRGFMPDWANIAMDIVVNTMLHENGFKIHPNWVQPHPQYSGWTFERVYYEITKHLQAPPPPPPEPQEDEEKKDEDDADKSEDDEESSGGDEQDDEEGEDDEEQESGGDGEGEEEEGEEEESPDGAGAGEGTEEGEEGEVGEGDPQGSGFCDGPDIPRHYQGAWKDVEQVVGSREEIEAFEEKVDRQVQQALETAKMMGNAPVGVEMQVAKNVIIAEEKWFDHLQRYFQALRMAEYDWRKVDRRMMMRHRVIAPTQYTERLGPVVVYVDASGSCFSAAQQADFTSHINAILSEAMPSRVHVVYFEMDVTKVVEMDPGEIEFEESAQGGGGTDFSGLFKWAEENDIHPHVAIVLTDMYGTFPKEAPEFPVVWAATSTVVAPFGDTIQINKERSYT